MAMGKGPGGGGFNIPFTPDIPFTPTTPFEPFVPPPQDSVGSYDPMMDMYGSTTQVLQPMPGYYEQFPIPGGYSPMPAPEPMPMPQPMPQPQPPMPPPFSPMPFNPFALNFDYGFFNSVPFTDEVANSEPPPQQVQPNNFQIDLAPPPPDFYGGINPGGMYTPEPMPSPAQEIGNVFGNIRPSITAAETGIPASEFINPGRPESTLDLSQPGRGTSGLPQTRNELSMPILDALTVGRKDPGLAVAPTPVAPPPDLLPAPDPGFGEYLSNVRISPFMGGFNIGGIL